jgi:SEC-C motif-containing protein
MRSRFSAFAVGDDGYLLRTWHPTTRPRRIAFDPEQLWSHLEILDTTGGSLFDSDGTVQFRAHHSRHGRAGAQHEKSRFVRDDGRWVYLDGIALGVRQHTP